MDSRNRTDLDNRQRTDSVDGKLLQPGYHSKPQLIYVEILIQPMTLAAGEKKKKERSKNLQANSINYSSTFA